MVGYFKLGMIFNLSTWSDVKDAADWVIFKTRVSFVESTPSVKVIIRSPSEL